MSIRGLAWHKRLRLLWGKVRRLGLGLLRPGYVRRKAQLRRGACRRCGACCLLGHKCHFLRNSAAVTECRIHGGRPPNCRLFPIDERDLADRDLVAPGQPCGYSFDGGPAWDGGE